MQRLCYLRAGVKPRIEDEIMQLYPKGSKAPLDLISEQGILQLKSLAISIAAWLVEDYQKELFSSYDPYATSYGAKLSTIEEAVSFNNVHEAMHLGYMKALHQKVA